MENELFLVRYYWSLVWRRPLHWIVPLMAVALIGIFIVLQTQRTYVSTARVAAQSPQISGSLIQSTVTNERVQFFEQRVFSRENLVALADKLALFRDIRSTLTDGEIADIVRRQVTLQVVPTDPTDPASSSAILTISFEASTPEVAAAGANEVIQMLIAENRNARMSEASQVRTFLEQEVKTRRQQAESLDAEWNAFVSANEALLPSRLPIYTSEIQELQEELQAIQVASASLAADTRVLETQLSLASRPASSAETQLAQLRQELSTKQTIFSATHPDIVLLRARIATLEESLTQMEAGQDVAAVSPVALQSPETAMLNERVIAARQQQGDFGTRITQINERLQWLRTTITKMPEVEANLLSLQRRHDAADNNLTDMQSRYDTAVVGERLQNAQEDSQISVIDKPEVPIYAAGSGRSRAMVIVAALALISGVASLIVLDLLNRTIKSKRDLGPLLEGGSLVLIPDWNPAKTSRLPKSLPALIIVLAFGAMIAPGGTGLTDRSSPGLVQHSIWHS